MCVYPVGILLCTIHGEGLDAVWAGMRFVRVSLLSMRVRCTVELPCVFAVCCSKIILKFMSWLCLSLRGPAISRDSFKHSLKTFYFQYTRVHSASELLGRCALQIYLLTYLLDLKLVTCGGAQSTDYLSPSNSVLCHRCHLPAAVPEARHPHYFFRISLPRLPSFSAGVVYAVKFITYP